MGCGMTTQTEYIKIDLDRLQSMCRERVLAYHEFGSLMDCYGKGYILAREEFKRCVEMLLGVGQPLQMSCGSKTVLTPTGECYSEPTLQRGLVWDMDDLGISLEYNDGAFVCYVGRDPQERGRDVL